MKRIGIMGGTFSPIHYGHLMLAENAYDRMNLDEIWFIPSADPPHKDSNAVLEYQHRSAMTELAIEDIPYFIRYDFEIKRDAPSYTSETLRLLHEAYPDYKFYFIMGADSLFQLETWYEPEKVMSRAVLLAAVRDHHSDEEMNQRIQYLKDKYHADIQLINMPEIAISSDLIRSRVRNHQSIRFFVPESVRQYIIDHRLYEGNGNSREVFD